VIQRQGRNVADLDAPVDAGLVDADRNARLPSKIIVLSKIPPSGAVFFMKTIDRLPVKNLSGTILRERHALADSFQAWLLLEQLNNPKIINGF
jgi:hypothetical protein